MCAHELWPMVNMHTHKAIPGVFICRACYYNSLGWEPQPHSTAALGFSIENGMQILFKKPGPDGEDFQRHHM